MTADLAAAPVILSRLRDLDRFPLAALASRRGDLDDTVGRVLPDAAAKAVPVAAFNSALG